MSQIDSLRLEVLGPLQAHSQSTHATSEINPGGISSIPAVIAFVALFAFRYLRLLVAIVANLTYQPYPIVKPPRFTNKDATVIVPRTFRKPTDLALCLISILKSNLTKIVVVTARASLIDALELVQAIDPVRIRVIGVDKLNKREQIVHGLKFVSTDVTVLADDNVIWPDDFLRQMLAVFVDPRVGAGGPRQRVRRDKRPGIFNLLAIGYLERRVFNNIATQAIDGSISTLSGRTIVCRTKIINNDDFTEYFLNDSWKGVRLFNDDDKCLTRWFYSRGWKIAIQTSTCIETTMEPGLRYLIQCKRWARSHWRGNFMVMSKERYWYAQHYWGLYYIYIGQFQTPALLWDGLLFYLLHLSTHDYSRRGPAFIVLTTWILFAKLVKLVPHFLEYPQDLVFVPASLLFSYLHGVINIFALLTLHKLGWGTQHLKDLEKPKEHRESKTANVGEVLRKLDRPSSIRMQWSKTKG